MKAPAKRSAAAGGSAPQRALTLASRGDDDRQIQACANCHGPGGTGVGEIPYLAGLHAGYLQASLGEWKAGTRRTDPSSQMPRIAKQLTDADIKALASYYASQPAPQRRASAKPPASGTAEPTAPGVARKAREGSDVTGTDPSGSQGPGGAGSR
jgi:cytochrome c553